MKSGCSGQYFSRIFEFIIFRFLDVMCDLVQNVEAIRIWKSFLKYECFP